MIVIIVIIIILIFIFTFNPGWSKVCEYNASHCSTLFLTKVKFPWDFLHFIIFIFKSHILLLLIFGVVVVPELSKQMEELQGDNKRLEDLVTSMQQKLNTTSLEVSILHYIYTCI